MDNNFLKNWKTTIFSVEKPAGSIYERGYDGSRMLI
jgi:hypothetical protein